MHLISHCRKILSFNFRKASRKYQWEYKNLKKLHNSVKNKGAGSSSGLQTGHTQLYITEDKVFSSELHVDITEHFMKVTET